MAGNPNSRPVITTSSSSYWEFKNSSTEGTQWYDKQFMQNMPKYLIVVEVILGLLVWTLIASTRLTNRQIQHESWPTVVLVFNCSAALLYMSAAIVEATMIDHDVKGHHDYNCWAASTFFAFLISLSYAGSAFFSFKSWQSRDE
ncbi:CKLF-like MARVEL transmembrane domain-containing protein 8 isoform X3 [Misgurnus anguillicaudatus]|uniref:CKLF-like MARVEL transmembrane domain-containing protein 8 isoform X3 n=1 Tax=Misgurnus anguillicaudatus TaxID=75329 RepID=UPI003CCF2883